jgi:hypothetical protein
MVFFLSILAHYEWAQAPTFELGHHGAGGQWKVLRRVGMQAQQFLCACEWAQAPTFELGHIFVTVEAAFVFFLLACTQLMWSFIG